MKYKNINEEELEDLQEVMSHKGWKVVEKVIAEISGHHDIQILGYNLAILDSVGFIALKNRNEGLHWFIKELKEHRNNLVKQKSLGGKSERRK